MTTFRFQQFEVVDDDAAMKIGTDGILLGAWTDCSRAKRILDIGTGCGLIALMLAQRTAKLQTELTAIEIDGDAANQAERNFVASPWSERLRIVAISFEDYCLAFSKNRKDDSVEGKFDLIVCNLPFFEPPVSKPSSSKQGASTCNQTRRELARQSSKLVTRQIFSHALDLLSPKGTINLVMPFNRLAKTVREAQKFGFGLARQTSVRTLPNQPFKRALVRFNLGLNELSPDFDELTIERVHHEYTAEFAELTSEFYLRFAE